ncbi:preprotein translocase subunit SecY [Anaerosacchariphilus polymeriproducens]|uniref:Protein translocase subunit SecY n=1 Tax=Anaerosacchariphilus polymeriproducens TaxID=1812858 RepID=A0A371AQC3_9FIRM|nr:preprotein translocase subunit SecY [Anaerosacchariphilus polymeriproducens]RDU21776.1 preprotein translocase subunit SecY [Anaerosacchariphilus polymeriproducens]
MLKTLRNAFKIEDIRKRIIYTFLMLIVIRIGAQLPVPGVKSEVFAEWFSSQGGTFNFFDAVTGGSLMNMSIFALSITPYITSSIIIQLLTIAIPKLEEMQKEGEDGRKKLNEFTRYLAVGLSLVESIAMGVGFGNQNLLERNTFMYIAVVATALTAGSTFLMWVGERITEKGVGNGISIVLMINIVSRIPDDMIKLFNQFVKGKAFAPAMLAAAIILAIILLVIVFVIFLQGGERRIPVQYAKKVQGRKMVGGQSTHIPLKVNTASVIPIIFAQSILQFPVMIAGFVGKGKGSGLSKVILDGLTQNNWCDPENLKNSWGLVLYILMVIAFAYFYTSITFNPLEVANNMKKQGGFIPGIRPGKPTSDYLTKILNYIVFIGAVGLIIVAVIPIFFNGVYSANVSFGGTSIIIIVGVVIETLKQIESQMLVRNYKGFLTD